MVRILQEEETMTTAIAIRDLRDKVFPIGGDGYAHVNVPKKVLTGECIQCGKCCTAMHLSGTLDGKPIHQFVREWLDEWPEPDEEWDYWAKIQHQTFTHVLRHFVEWNEYEARIRGLNDEQLFYCKLLVEMDGKFICPIHDRKPRICKEYPFYKDSDPYQETVCIHAQCGYIDQEAYEEYLQNQDG